MLHVWGLPISTNHRRVWRDLGMPARRKEAISFFQILPFHGKSSKSGQDLDTRVRPSEAKQEWGDRDTKEVLGGKGRSFGRSGRVDFIHWYISTVGVWDHTHAYDTFHLRCEKSSARIVCCTPALYVWLVSHVFRHEGRPVCPLQDHHICAEKEKINWEELLTCMIGVSVSWFPRWKEGWTEVLCWCEGFPNVPLMGTMSCINYNPILAYKSLAKKLFD